MLREGSLPQAYRHILVIKTNRVIHMFFPYKRFHVINMNKHLEHRQSQGAAEINRVMIGGIPAPSVEVRSIAAHGAVLVRRVVHPVDGDETQEITPCAIRPRSFTTYSAPSAVRANSKGVLPPSATLG